MDAVFRDLLIEALHGFRLFRQQLLIGQRNLTFSRPPWRLAQTAASNRLRCAVLLIRFTHPIGNHDVR
jgi:hypothetical protein